MSRFWLWWLETTLVITILFGVAYALLGVTAVFAPFVDPIMRGFWPDGAVPAGVRRFAMFNFGTGGGLTAGLGLLAWFVTRHAIRRGERWGGVAVGASVSLWFVVDSGMSIHAGVPANALFNLILLISVAVPLIVLWPHLRARPAAGPK